VSNEPPDMNALLQQAMAMQQQLVAAQHAVQEQTVEGTSGAGVVKITMTGGGDVTRVRIDPSAVDPADVEMLEDMIVAALRDAAAKVAALQQQAMGGLGDLGGLGGLGGLLGGG
jgi:nucleoid-associated protein EbfC